MPFAYFYGRVSHEDSASKQSKQYADRCMSVDVQLEMCQRRFEYDRTVGGHPELAWGSAGWVGTRREGKISKDGVFIDQVVSAFKIDWTRRPAGGRCFAQLQKGDTLYAAYLDRMFRRNYDQAVTLRDFDKRGIRLVLINENLDSTNPYHHFMMQIMSSVSELDSLAKSRRIKEALAYRKAKGMKGAGRARMGWRNRKTARGTHLEPNDEDREMRLKVVHLRDVEKLSWPAISDVIEKELAQAQNRRVLPEHAGDKLPARKWSYFNLQYLYEQTDMMPPSHMLPPGTKDSPPPPKSAAGQAPTNRSVGTLNENLGPLAGENCS
jgi:DNA invertase Pin-like site-specific DNA recombinase